MEIEITSKPSFAVLGVEGRGPADEGPQWIKPLWDAVRTRMDEIRPLIIGRRLGTYECRG